MNALMKYGPAPLESLKPALQVIPADVLPWIVEKHLQYLDDKIHKIDILTEYLINCSQVEIQRNEFVRFVETWSQSEEVDLEIYLDQYSQKYRTIRNRVDSLLDRILYDHTIWANKSTLNTFWQDFANANELDSLHGMFLTSGRWYVNVTTPSIKEIIYCCLPNNVPAKNRNALAYSISRRLITPAFAPVRQEYDPSLDKTIISLLIPLLTYFDRATLFLFEDMRDLFDTDRATNSMFLHDVTTNPAKYDGLLDRGIYPPFAWHELIASKRRRRSIISYEEATQGIRNNIPHEFRVRLQLALDSLAVIKRYEVDYNTYNYKGRFNLVSKYLYWTTLQWLNEKEQPAFLDTILLDRFYDALRIINNSSAEGD